jgi:hypothetical protein
MFKDGIGIFLWKLAVGLYLIANGILGITSNKSGDFDIILTQTMKFPSWVAMIIAVLALVAGVMVLIEMFGITIRSLDFIALVLAIIWAVYIVIGIISFLKGQKDFLFFLQRLAVHTMVLASLLQVARKGR